MRQRFARKASRVLRNCSLEACKVIPPVKPVDISIIRSINRPIYQYYIYIYFFDPSLIFAPYF